MYRNTRPLARTIRPPAPRVIQNIVHQTVIHLHQTTRRYTLSRLSAVGAGRGGAVLLVRQAAVQPVRDGAVDASRPALAARRLLRLLSAESARQTLRPFYQKLFRELLAQELEKHRSRPAQSLLLARCVLGRRTLDSFILHSFIYRRYVCRVRQDGERYFFHRSAGPRQALPGNLPHPAEERVSTLLPPPEPPERGPNRPLPKGQMAEGAAATAGLRLSGAEFRLLVRGVADALGRQGRLDTLRRGGM